MNGLILISLLIAGCSAQYGGLMGTKTAAPMAAPAPLPMAAPAPAPLPMAPVQQIRTIFSAPVQSFAAPVQTYAAPVQQSYGPIEAAIQTRRTVEIRPVLVEEVLAQPQIIEVGPNFQDAVQIHFRTASSRLNVAQSHIPSAPATVEHTSVQDNAHRLVHEVTKPVIQEVREVIQPYRRITQEIRPVIEEIHTIVHKGERRVAQPAPLPLKMAAPAYGAGAGMAANAAYKAAKA